MPSNRAFTLLELLVVITIIGILSSIVIVSMSGSTDSATIAKGKAYAQQIHALLGSNAVGVWNFDEGEGSTVYDISGHGNHGTLYGDTHFVSSDIEGHTLSFDGSGDYIDCGGDTSFNFGDSIDFSIELWIKAAQHNNISNKEFFGKGYLSNPSSICGYVVYNTGKVYFSVRDINNNTASAVSNEIIDDDNWHHVISVFNRDDKIYIYIDGILSGTPSNMSSIGNLNNAYPLKLGSGTWSQSLNGLIDEVRIYSEALPSTEIQKHYVQGLKKLLINQVITQSEYDQRIEEFNQYLVSK
jgi:prepilin-type N-terminal cleavage/methylation domain-containing protein